MELDSFSARVINTAAEGLSSVELEVTTGDRSRKKLHTIRQRPAGMQRLVEPHKQTIGKGTLKRLRAKVADTKMAKTARTAETAQAAGGGGAEEEEYGRWRAPSTRARAMSSSRNGW